MLPGPQHPLATHLGAAPHTRAHKRLRGFTLLELMVVMALIAIVAALAAPSVAPSLRREALQSSTNSVLLFLSAARMEAMSSRRCVRVRLLGAAAGTSPATTAVPHAVLVRERLNSFDCENITLDTTVPANPPRITTTAPFWVESGRLIVEPDNLLVSFAQAPGQNETGGNLDGAGDLRYRPNGRLFSSDTDTTNDDAAIKLVHPKMTAPYNATHVVAEGQGALCIKNIGIPVATGAGLDLNCP